jgi:hypothetical protein
MQLSLWDLREPVKLTRADELSREADAFLASHPDVWRLFVGFAFDLIRAGNPHGGAKAIWERIRWERATSAHRRGDEWSLNNSLVAPIARVFAETYPEHAAFFRFRERSSSSSPARQAAA